jgi:hypothetical protein
MGLMDKVKTQATQIADKAQQAGQVGQAKIAEMQAKKRADALLLELGGLHYLDRAGRPAPDGEARIASLVDRIKGHEAEYGPVSVTVADGGGTSQAG